MRPTADCIMNSFLTSGKKHIVITGAKKSGKSTLIKEIKEKMGLEDMPGITTAAVPKKCVVLKENNTENEAVIGIFDERLKKSTNAMLPVKEGFSALGIPALKRAALSSSIWVSIDEIGYIESGEPDFQKAVIKAFDAKNVIAAVRKENTEFILKILNRKDVFVIDLDEYAPKIGCVIMASGMGKRFGSNKLLAEFNGESFIGHMLKITDGVFDARAVVTRSTEVYDICIRAGCRAVIHQLPNRNDTVRIGTELMEKMDAVVFCPCDQIMLSKESLIKIREKFYFEGTEIIRLGFGEKQGAPVLFGKRFFDELKNLPEQKGGSYIAQKYAHKAETVEAENELELFDVDTKEDLEYLKKIVKLK